MLKKAFYRLLEFLLSGPKSGYIGGCQTYYDSKTFIGFTPDGRYVHSTKHGRTTYHPGYYAIDGTLLQPHVK